MLIRHAYDGEDQGRPAGDDDSRFLDVLADVAARLRVACAHMDEQAFAALVSEVARRKLHWSDRDGRPSED